MEATQLLLNQRLSLHVFKTEGLTQMIIMITNLVYHDTQKVPGIQFVFLEARENIFPKKS